MCDDARIKTVAMAIYNELQNIDSINFEVAKRIAKSALEAAGQYSEECKFVAYVSQDTISRLSTMKEDAELFMIAKRPFGNWTVPLNFFGDIS